jgi:hypothetical protein
LRFTPGQPGLAVFAEIPGTGWLVAEPTGGRQDKFEQRNASLFPGSASEIDRSFEVFGHHEDSTRSPTSGTATQFFPFFCANLGGGQLSIRSITLGGECFHWPPRNFWYTFEPEAKHAWSLDSSGIWCFEFMLVFFLLRSRTDFDGALEVQMRFEQIIAAVTRRLAVAEVREITVVDQFAAALRLHLWQLRMWLGMPNYPDSALMSLSDVSLSDARLRKPGHFGCKRSPGQFGLMQSQLLLVTAGCPAGRTSA